MDALLALVVVLQIQVRDEAKDWRLITTENFNVYYPEDALLPRAREFAGWFEDARARLIRQFGVAPPRVNVFLYRSYHDLLQASFLGKSEPVAQRMRGPILRERRRECSFCRPNPRSRALALAEPLRDRIFIHCQPGDRWNAWFARHELAHHVQFEHLFAFRMPSWLIAVKDRIVPMWWWEGGADYAAGIFDTAKDQYMRDLASERLYDLKELFFPDVLNPYDYQAIYYEGSYFWKFVEEHQSRAASRRVFEAYDEGLPIPSQVPLADATGRSREELEADFAKWLEARWKPMLAGRSAPSERLTDTREYYRRRAWGGRWSPDGKRLAWIGNKDVWPDLYVDGRGMIGWRRGVDSGVVVSPPTWSPDGRRLAVVEWITNKDVLTVVDLDGGLESIHLEFDELYDPAWSPDGKTIAFAALKHGVSDLYLLRLEDRRVERLTDDAAGDSAPAWSRDGRLAFVKESEGRTVLHVHGQGPVSRTWALLEYPQWSPDGREIVVAADVDGTYDAFALDPATGKAKRLTRYRGGVSYPAYHPADGSLVVTYYEGRGQDLYRVSPAPQDEPRFDQEERKPWYDQFKKPEPLGAPAEKSRVWGVDWLMFPVSSASLLLPGVEFAVGDRDGENQLFFGAAGISSRLWSAQAVVRNTRWRPTLGAFGSVVYSGDLREWSAGPFVELPLYPTLTTSVGWLGRHRDEDEEDVPDPEFTDSGPTASFLFSNQTSYHLFDPAWGVAFGGTASYFSEDLGGDREQREYHAFFETSTDLAQDWIVWLRADYRKTVGRELIESELFDLEHSVRGADELEAPELGTVTLELRFPLWRDFLWKPLEILGLGEFLILKDLRGFVFGQVGYGGAEFGDAFDDDFGAASAGVGLRLDFSWMAWPAVNARVPTRFEVWWAIVGEDEDDPRGELGAGIRLGF